MFLLGICNEVGICNRNTATLFVLNLLPDKTFCGDFKTRAPTRMLESSGARGRGFDEQGVMSNGETSGGSTCGWSLALCLPSV